jgi:hypothetical protein
MIHTIKRKSPANGCGDQAITCIGSPQAKGEPGGPGLSKRAQWALTESRNGNPSGQAWGPGLWGTLGFRLVGATVWVLVFLQNSHVKILTFHPQVIVLGGKAYGRWLGLESRVLLHGISALVLDTSFAPSAMWGHNKKDDFLWTRKQVLTRHHICRWLYHGLFTSRIMGNKFLLFISHYGTFNQQPEQTKTNWSHRFITTQC